MSTELTETFRFSLSLPKRLFSRESGPTKQVKQNDTLLGFAPLHPLRKEYFEEVREDLYVFVIWLPFATFSFFCKRFGKTFMFVCVGFPFPLTPNYHNNSSKSIKNPTLFWDSCEHTPKSHVRFSCESQPNDAPTPRCGRLRIQLDPSSVNT